MLVLSRTPCVALLLICAVLLLFEGCCSSNDPLGTQDDQYCIPGDADANGVVDIYDACFLLYYIFSGGPAPDQPCCSDLKRDGNIDIDDFVLLILLITKDGSILDPDACQNWPG